MSESITALLTMLTKPLGYCVQAVQSANRLPPSGSLQVKQMSWNLKPFY